ncbi:MAG: hypothetical protein EOP84_06560 [Verrucomicrobiaceae bacterium]|nr:MAG: hypothetical protein EOP84_06560 [Verrucomicrobiaceae bacterium]
MSLTQQQIQELRAKHERISELLSMASSEGEKSLPEGPERASAWTEFVKIDREFQREVFNALPVLLDTLQQREEENALLRQDRAEFTERINHFAFTAQNTYMPEMRRYEALNSLTHNMRWAVDQLTDSVNESCDRWAELKKRRTVGEKTVEDKSA